MNTRHLIKKLLFIAITLAACSGLVVLLVAAKGKRNQKKCKGYEIRIKGAEKTLFINESDVKKLLDAGIAGKIRGEPVSDFDLRKLEQLLEKNEWVQNANLYFDNRNVLHVSILEKEPLARIFTTVGKSFYIDNDGQKMPLSNSMSARVPVFTNFPDKKSFGAKDATLLNDIKEIASFISKDSFWMAQTEQIDIAGGENLEMVPTIGNHIVKLGSGLNIDKKLHRLLIFYQQVMSKTGFDKYNIIDVRFDGQVIGSTTKTSKIDSIQLRKNVEKLIDEARQMQQDSIAATPLAARENITPHRATAAATSSQEQTNSNPRPTGSSGRALKTTTPAKPKLIEKKTVQR